MSDRYVILRRGDRQFCESWDTLPQAERALEILNTHEENCGRGKDYWFIEDREAKGSPANTKEGA